MIACLFSRDLARLYHDLLSNYTNLVRPASLVTVDIGVSIQDLEIDGEIVTARIWESLVRI